MTSRRLGILLVLSIGFSIWFGALDSTVHTPGDLFTVGNAPALVIFAAIAFTILFVGSLGLSATWGAIRSKRTGAGERG